MADHPDSHAGPEVPSKLVTGGATLGPQPGHERPDHAGRADPGKTALLCLFHDTQESRIGDVPSVGKGYVVTAPNPQVTADQVADFPAEIGEAVRGLVGEYEVRESIEARLARDADKLECLIQAREYQVQGHEDVPPWIETSAAALQSTSAKLLAETCQQVPPREWWKAFAEAYPNPIRQPGR